MLSRFERTTSSSTSSSRIWWQSSNKRILEAIFTGRRLFASLSGDFQVFFAPRSTSFCRIFDINKDGFIDKREFRWMTSSTVISPQVIQTVFQVLNHQRYLNDQISTFKALSKTYFFSVVKQWIFLSEMRQGQERKTGFPRVPRDDYKVVAKLVRKNPNILKDKNLLKRYF